MLRPRSRFLNLAVLCGALTACETSPTLPTHAEGPPPFSRVAWDWSSLTPKPGSSFSVGQTLAYRADAFFEFAPDDLPEDGDAVALLYLEAMSVGGASGEVLFSEGRLDVTRMKLGEDESSGTIGFEGTITIPDTSPDCYDYNLLRLRARIGDAAIADTLDSEKVGASQEIVLPFPVSGSYDPLEPCVRYDAWTAESDWAWGDHMSVELVNRAPGQDLTYTFGDRPESPFYFPLDFESGFASTFLRVGGGFKGSLQQYRFEMIVGDLPGFPQGFANRGLTGAAVEGCRDGGEIISGVFGEVSPFWEVLSQQAVGVFVHAPLPRAMRVAEVDGQARVDAELRVLSHLRSLVPCQRPAELLW